MSLKTNCNGFVKPDVERVNLFWIESESFCSEGFARSNESSLKQQILCLLIYLCKDFVLLRDSLINFFLSLNSLR